MRVLLDEIPCPMEADTVGKAIAQAAAIAQQRGRMIIEVFVDGQPWNSEQLDSTEDQAQTASEIRLTSAKPLELVSQTFADASRALSDAIGLQETAAEYLQKDQIADAMGRLQEAISIWLSVQQALAMGLDLAEINPANFDAASDSSTIGTFPKMVDELNGHLRQMQAALEGQDTTALADTLMYDLPPVARRWQDLLDDLQAHLAGRMKDA